MDEKILYKDLSYKLQGLFFDIRNDLGSGHKEIIYQKALEQELKQSGIIFEREPSIKVYSRKGFFLGLYRPDFLIDNKIIIELKAAPNVSKPEIVRIYDYLRNSDYELAYLVNFASPNLYIRRFLYTNDRKFNFKKFAAVCISFVGICLSLFVAIREVMAAELYFDANEKQISVNQEFQTNIYLNTEGAAINAVGAEINFPEDLLEMTDWSDGGSVINFWVKRPEAKNGKVFFEGVILGAHQSDKGLLAVLKFKTLKEGTFDISFASSSQAFIHDGQGTKAELTFKNLKVAATGQAVPPAPLFLIKDTEPPEPFEPIIARDSNVFGGQWFLIFKTEDSGSGMDYFDVLETSPFWMLKEPAPEKAISPYLLKDQNLESIIKVRAVDKAGNIRSAELPPKNPPPFIWHKNPFVWFIILLILIVSADIGILVWKVVRRPSGRKKLK